MSIFVIFWQIWDFFLKIVKSDTLSYFNVNVASGQSIVIMK